MEKRENWSSRLSFILAAVGSAVGLGNAWRFPGLCAKDGGGAFLVAYIIAMVVIGVPLLAMEIAIGRKSQAGAPKAMRLINKKAEFVGWAATSNAFFILTYYAVVFAWCILMTIVSFKFATSASDVDTAGSLWMNEIGVTWGTSFKGAGGNIPVALLVCVLIAWGFIYGCIRKGTSRVSKVVKYTVFLPVAMLVILAIKGFINNDRLGDALGALFIPKWESFGDPKLWIDAIGQAFYSLSIMMAIMFAYGSYVSRSETIAEDAMIIAVADFACSVLSGIVLFTTMYQTGRTVDDMSASGIATAFIIYPQSIVMLTNVPALNAIFGFVFYFMLCTLAVDSAFSILEGVSAAVADKFLLDKKKTTKMIAIIAGLISIVYTTGAGVGWLDIVDNWTNQYTLIIIGILEAICVGWFCNTKYVLDEVNLNTKAKGFKMPKWWFYGSVKYVAPAILAVLLVWQMINLGKAGFRYNAADYALAAEIIGGWIVTVLCFASGFIVKFACKHTKRGRTILALEAKEPTWAELNEKQELAEDFEMEVMKEENVDVQDGKIVDDVVNDEPVVSAPATEDKQ